MTPAEMAQNWTIGYSDMTNNSFTTVSYQINGSESSADSYHYSGADKLASFNIFYKPYHGYIATIVCILGIIANMLNIVVLTRRNMISATNCILTGLAVSDGLTLVAYLPFALRFYCLYGTEVSPERNTLGAIRFMLFYACFSVVVHTVSIWLTVTLTVFRYIFIKHPRRGTVMCTLQRAKIAVFLNYVVTLIVCIPNFVTITVQGSPMMAPDNSTYYLWFVQYKLDNAVDNFVYKFNFWIQAILVKLVPCVGLTILSALLVRTMKKADRRRRNLKMKSTMKSAERESSRDRKTNRTTRMLLVVVFLFLLTEFPQGILNLLSGILSHFVEEVYWPLGDLVDILALINNCVNFILYCSMSKQFRDTFIDIFLSQCSKNMKRFTLVPTSTKSEI
ncbi:hypothetical protein LSH36_949g00001 [Paralvinella palmiformis]|uniref:G-protein coupled receptors family 1 profile domain-containing protein n=1 Tax=Paralvinella palmiformis TaxID=53620 RepID=A0AAD9IXM5_9ANNE|nr:hypothetical protein LSH36_949g00001 [Paralvinella palmiformis]